MPFVVEIHGLEDCLHGQLADIIDRALRREGKAYKHMAVTYREEKIVD